jgi:hypothetical protein
MYELSELTRTKFLYFGHCDLEFICPSFAVAGTATEDGLFGAWNL